MKTGQKKDYENGNTEHQGIPTKQVEVFKELGKHNIVVLKETKRKGKDTEGKYWYVHVYSAYWKKRENGVEYL